MSTGNLGVKAGGFNPSTVAKILISCALPFFQVKSLIRQLVTSPDLMSVVLEKAKEEEEKAKVKGGDKDTDKKTRKGGRVFQSAACSINL